MGNNLCNVYLWPLKLPLCLSWKSVIKSGCVWCVNEAISHCVWTKHQYWFFSVWKLAVESLRVSSAGPPTKSSRASANDGNGRRSLQQCQRHAAKFADGSAVTAQGQPQHDEQPCSCQHTTQCCHGLPNGRCRKVLQGLSPLTININVSAGKLIVFHAPIFLII